MYLEIIGCRIFLIVFMPHLNDLEILIPVQKFSFTFCAFLLHTSEIVAPRSSVLHSQLRDLQNVTGTFSKVGKCKAVATKDLVR